MRWNGKQSIAMTATSIINMCVATATSRLINTIPSTGASIGWMASLNWHRMRVYVYVWTNQWYAPTTSFLFISFSSFHPIIIGFNETEAMIKLKEKLMELNKEGRKSKKSWSERMVYQEENWRDHYPQIQSAMIAKGTPPDEGHCLQCGEMATVHCSDCDHYHKYLCGDCDIKTHQHNPFHRRFH